MEMNKTILFFASLLFAGCASSQIDMPESCVQFCANCFSTRTTVTSGENAYVLSWNDSDRIGLYSSDPDDGANYSYKTVTGEEQSAFCSLAPSESGKVFCPKPGPTTYYAYYPFDVKAGKDPSEVHFSLPVSQVQVKAGDMSHLGKSFFLYSTPASSDGGAEVGLDFSGVFSIVELSLKMTSGIQPSVKCIRLVSEGAPLAFDGIIDLTSNVSGITRTKTFDSVELGFEKGLVLNNTYKSVYLVVAPGTHAQGELRLEIYTVDGMMDCIALPAVTFESNCGYSRSVEIDADDFSVVESFDVKPVTLSAVAGQPVSFSIGGSADMIDFWSGEKSHEWIYRDGGEMQYAEVSMSFKSHVQAGDQEPLSIKWSSDYSGSGTQAAVRAATWNDITSRFTIASDRSSTVTPTTNSGFVKSGIRSVSDAFGDGEGPVYFAVFYYVEPYALDKKVRTIAYVSEMKIDMELEGECANLFTESKSSFPIIIGDEYAANNDGTKPSWNTTLNGIKFASTSKPVGERNAYAVTPPLKRIGKRVGADTPETVKNLEDVMPSSFTYVFKDPGTYEVVFVGSMNTFMGIKEVVRQFNITVE